MNDTDYELSNTSEVDQDTMDRFLAPLAISCGDDRLSKAYELELLPGGRIEYRGATYIGYDAFQEALAVLGLDEGGIVKASVSPGSVTAYRRPQYLDEEAVQA